MEPAVKKTVGPDQLGVVQVNHLVANDFDLERVVEVVLDLEQRSKRCEMFRSHVPLFLGTLVLVEDLLSLGEDSSEVLFDLILIQELALSFSRREKSQV